MGGIPTSKGCKACRQQKKKCEGSHAPCDRCSRLGIDCLEFGKRQFLFKIHSSKPVAPRPQTEVGKTQPVYPKHPTYSRKRDVNSTNNTDEKTIILVELPKHGTLVYESASDHQEIVGSGSYNHNTLLLHRPQSQETTLIIRALDTLKYEDAEQAWFRHLPTRVGLTVSLDLSIKVIVVACAFARSVPNISLLNCRKVLGRALISLQKDLDDTTRSISDETLAATSLLAGFEGVTKKHGVPMRSHLEGLAAILACRPEAFPVTQLARDIVDFHICDFFMIATTKGIPSTLEKISSDYYISSPDPNPAGSIRLRALGIELFIRLPRLIALLSPLKSTIATHANRREVMISYARTLLLLENKAAEKDVLKEVIVVPGLCPAVLMCQKAHFSFASVEQFESLMYYWQSRLSLLRLWRRLHLERAPLTITTLGCSMSKQKTRLELCRLANCIILSIEYASKLQLRKRRRLLSHAIVTVWGAMRDEPLLLCQLQDLEDLVLSRSWLILKINEVLAATPRFTADDLEEAADMFVGGPRKGRFASLYGMSQRT